MRKWLLATLACSLALLLAEGLLAFLGGEIYDPPLFPPALRKIPTPALPAASEGSPMTTPTQSSMA
jgi:hypothetical protein